jgi:hypothetical protein
VPNQNKVFLSYLILSYKDCSFCSDPFGKSYLSFNSLGKSYLSFNRGEDFLEINQSETSITCGGHVCYPTGTK